MHVIKIDSVMLNGLNRKKTMKIKLRADITYMIHVQDFDNEVKWGTLNAPITSKNAWTIAKHDAMSCLDKLID